MTTESEHVAQDRFDVVKLTSETARSARFDRGGGGAGSAAGTAWVASLTLNVAASRVHDLALGFKEDLEYLFSINIGKISRVYYQGCNFTSDSQTLYFDSKFADIALLALAWA